MSIKIANLRLVTFSCPRVGWKLYVKFDLRYLHTLLPDGNKKTPFPGTCIRVYNIYKLRVCVRMYTYTDCIIFAHTCEIIRTTIDEGAISDNRSRNIMCYNQHPGFFFFFCLISMIIINRCRDPCEMYILYGVWHVFNVILDSGREMELKEYMRKKLLD